MSHLPVRASQYPEGSPDWHPSPGLPRLFPTSKPERSRVLNFDNGNHSSNPALCQSEIKPDSGSIKLYGAFLTLSHARKDASIGNGILGTFVPNRASTPSLNISGSPDDIPSLASSRPSVYCSFRRIHGGAR